MQRSLNVTGVVFSKRQQCGDFKWMVKQPQYQNAIFVIMENFLDMMEDVPKAGGGTACLRIFTLKAVGDESKVRACGIPTGWSTETQGFPELTTYYSKFAIDLAMERLIILIRNNPHIDTVIYSCDDTNQDLVGTNIFKDTLSPNVVEYISKLLHNLPSRINRPTKWTYDKIEHYELGKLYPHALLQHMYEGAQLTIKRLTQKSKSFSSGTGKIASHSNDFIWKTIVKTQNTTVKTPIARNNIAPITRKSPWLKN
jgi:hypothetical protein